MELFSGGLPAVRVVHPKTGHYQYCHSQRDLDKWTKSEDEGGPGYVRNWPGSEYPKMMSHLEQGDISVKDEAEEEKYAKKGYNFNHWDNKQAKSAPPEAAGSFDPKAAADIAFLKAQNEALTAKFELLMAKLGESPERPQI